MSKHSLMSVKHFSRHLVPDGDEAALAKMMRQVRHWTALDLLRTAGPKATGTGVSRVYDEDELYKAVILEELVRIGVPAAFLEDAMFGESLEERKTSDLWKLAKTGQEDVFLNFASDAEENLSFNLLKDPTSYLELLKFAGSDKKPIEVAGITIQFSALLIINVTALFDRVPK